VALEELEQYAATAQPEAILDAEASEQEVARDYAA
jgi:hypothetical protein